jgi:hypothetical protein
VASAWSPFGSQVVARTSEIKRIAALPRRTWSEESAASLAVMLTRELKTPAGTMNLRPVQAVSLYEAMEVGGLFGPIRVGAGKSLVCALAPLVLEARNPVLLMPASLVSKTWDEYKALRQHWRLPTNVQIISYESLSLVASAQKLEYIRPDLIVADEAHFLKGHKAGRTRRVARYMHAHPETKFVAVSGTIMRSSIRDFAHLLRWALKGSAPVPVTDDEVATWADALDEHVNPLGRRQPGALFDLAAEPVEVAYGSMQARHVFQSRLLETKGVVASSKLDGVTCSIRIQALEYELSPVTEEHFKTLRAKWETPCGKGFTQATEFRAYARELALGFSYTWIAREKVGEWEHLVVESKPKQTSKKPPRPSTCDSTDLKPTQLGTKDTGTSLLNRRLRELRQTSAIAKQTQNASSSSSDSDYEIPSASPPTSTGCASIATDSRLKSMLRSLKEPATDVRSAIANYATEEAVGVSTTIMLPEKSEASCVPGTTEHSDCSEIALGLSEPLRTFLEANRPPSGWLSARREWCSFVREQISRSKKYDTMLQIANACRASLLPSETLDAWKEIESSYEPATRPIFYETTALETCLTWLKANTGIVWVEHRAFGEALSRLSGAPYFGPGGLDASGASIKDATGKHSVIASIAACGQGFNLQMFSKNLITSCPSGAATIEQVLGRTHRDGQLADEVEVWILLGCREQYEAFDRSLEGAKAAEALLGHSQKLLLADLCFPNIDDRKGPLWV